MKILLTGGAGYIGSNLVVMLIEAGYSVYTYDNLSNSSRMSIESIKKICISRNLDLKNFIFIEGDILDQEKLIKVFDENDFCVVVHLAALKSIGDSVNEPLNYYSNNISGTITLLRLMQKYNINNLIFSSSASVYGAPVYLPISENHPLSPTNPYAHTKLIVERLLSEFSHLKKFNVICLRYFNPVGAHFSGMLMDNPKNPTNLMPVLMQAADPNIRRKFFLYGDDFETVDGTGVRDYVHIEDLVNGHLSAINYLLSLERDYTDQGKFEVFNLGTGVGYSVLQIKQMVENISNMSISFEVVGRRAGDVASCFADVRLAKEKLKWEAKHGLEEMCKSSWNAYCKNGGQVNAK